jgi:hypothetical protein
MNIHRRWRGLIVEFPGLDWNSSAALSAGGGANCTMNDFTPRRGRRPSNRRLALWSPIQTRDRIKETRCMDPQLTGAEVREDLVLRVRQEIEEGVYDTPEKFEAALDRLADRLESD